MTPNPTTPAPTTDQPCTQANKLTCPHMKEVGSDSNSDYYQCQVCGLNWTTHDEEMK